MWSAPCYFLYIVEIIRIIMKLISKREGGNTDTTHDHEYTDWDAVMRFTKQFMNNSVQTTIN